jgi:hypothetical protein
MGNERLKPPSIPVYPFMINEGWFEDHVQGQVSEGRLKLYDVTIEEWEGTLKVYRNDPVGF